MMASHYAATPARRAAIALAFAALCSLAVAVGVSSQPADAARAKHLGNTKKSPKPNCPTPKRYRGPNAPAPPASKACLVLGRVTGFQVSGDGRKNLFKMPTDGKVVAWSIDLSKPTKSERGDLGELLGTEKLGGDPFARLAVLSKRSKGKRYKLQKQSKRMNLKRFLGTQPIFTLNNPMVVRKGKIIALTVPTWSPDLAVGRGKPSDRWRASRKKGHCQNRSDLLASKPQRKVDSTRQYGCVYTDRMLYWAYYVPQH
jgi:hypothetical protein